MGKSVTRYVNMHGSERLTIKEAEALQRVIDMGIAVAVDNVHDGVMTEADFNRAQKAQRKLYSCLYDTLKKIRVE